MFYHWGLTQLVSRLTGGLIAAGRYELAVDFFFILSGFVLGSNLIEKKPSLAGFFFRRCLRILPVSLVALVLCLPVLGFPLDASTLISNGLLLQGFFNKPHLNHVSWSACLELWLPPFMIFVPMLLKAAPRAILAAMAIPVWLFGGAFLAEHIFKENITIRDSLSDAIRAILGLLNGFVLCSLARTWPESRQPRFSSALALGLFGLAALTCVLGAELPFMVFLFPAVASCCLLFLLGSNTFLSSKPLLFLGTRSYAIYMLHWPVLMMADNWLGSEMLKGNVLLKLALVTLTIFLADIVHRSIELPCMRFRRNSRAD